MTIAGELDQGEYRPQLLSRPLGKENRCNVERKVTAANSPIHAPSEEHKSSCKAYYLLRLMTCFDVQPSIARDVATRVQRDGWSNLSYLDE